jgi:hypothetical protein
MVARSKCSNQRPDTLMQDRNRQLDENLLQRTAGPYNRVKWRRFLPAHRMSADVRSRTKLMQHWADRIDHWPDPKKVIADQARHSGLSHLVFRKTVTCSSPIFPLSPRPTLRSPALAPTHQTRPTWSQPSRRRSTLGRYELFRPRGDQPSIHFEMDVTGRLLKPAA